MIGRSSLHSEVRTFNLSRIASLEMLAEKIRHPARVSASSGICGTPGCLIPGDGADEQVVIRFKPLVAQNVGEVIWHKTQQLEFQADGSLIFRGPSVRVWAKSCGGFWATATRPKCSNHRSCARWWPSVSTDAGGHV